jgi:hypothetical protein
MPLRPLFEWGVAAGSPVWFGVLPGEQDLEVGSESGFGVKAIFMAILGAYFY